MDSEILNELCDRFSPEGALESLVDEINAAAKTDGLAFHLVHSDRNWYKLGGIVDPSGKRISDNLEEWVEAEASGDAMGLFARYGESGLKATAILGNTHYLVAPTGDKPTDFVQLQIDEIRETLDRELFDPASIPETLEDIIDPLDAIRVEPEPLTPPKFVFRTITDLSKLSGELTGEYTGDPRFKRFLAEWKRSAAARYARFCDKWAVEIIPYLTGMGDHRQDVKLLSADMKLLDRLDLGHLPTNQPIYPFLAKIDEQADYPMAWYFLMVAAGMMPYGAVKAVARELKEPHFGRPSMTPGDMALLQGWIEDPYHL